MSDHRYDVFISYARRDGSQYAARLEEVLAAEQFRTWRDKRNLDPDQDFSAELERAIEDSDQVVCCVTPDVRRDNSFVRREIGFAQALSKPIVPLVFEATVPPIMIVNVTREDFTYTPWDQAVQGLCGRLRRGGNQISSQISLPIDPYRDYLHALYKQLVYFLDRTVFSLITLQGIDTPEAVESGSSQRNVLPMIFFNMVGLESGATDPTTYASFQEAFGQHEGRVLLLGEPGAGKTTTLFAFARDRVTRRLEDPLQPLPLIASLATWNPQAQTPLTAWLSNEIKALRPDDLAKVIGDGQALLLLDGLDELGREREDSQSKQCYDPRARFVEMLDPTTLKNQVVVTCRVHEYSEIGMKLALNGAVMLQPLTDEQIRGYLRDVPDLWVALEADPHLRDVARTPLLLSLFAEGYREQGLSAQEREQLRDLRRSPGDLRDRIFEQYVHGRYERERRRVNVELLFKLEEIYDVLGWVAMLNTAGEMRLTSRHLVEENVLERVDFLQKLDEKRLLSFVELAANLHLLVQNEGRTFRFVHLILRDYFAFNHACKCRYDPYWRIRRSAAIALGRLGDVRAVSLLIELLLDTDARVRRSAAAALGRLRDLRAVEPLITALHDKNMWVRRDAAMSLSGLHDARTVEALLMALQDNATVVRVGAAFALGESREPLAVLALIEALKDRKKEVRSESAVALGKIGDARAVNSLIARLRDRQREVQSNAADALRRIGTSEAMVAYQDWNTEVRKEYWKYRLGRGKKTE